MSMEAPRRVPAFSGSDQASTGAHSSIRPSASRTTRSACWAIWRSWVTNIIVRSRSRFKSRSSSRTPWPVELSRFPVGSSAKKDLRTTRQTPGRSRPAASRRRRAPKAGGQAGGSGPPGRAGPRASFRTFFPHPPVRHRLRGESDAGASRSRAPSARAEGDRTGR